jgi:hypothetical protein
MKILKKIFHKHVTEDVSCPFTQRTYIICKECGMKIGIRNKIK